ncbi:aspartate aminotransferase 1 [Actinidia rufa]|uniref:Aspartate aminotransferase 1 n=1 Tax=Actinidia rufa TaxID=165716 RepID=A0A7J0DYW3_9ERIC|nr:aspartate aminotransferase 1 [Actinidia rufa]
MAMSRRVLSSSTGAAAFGARSMSSWWQSVEPAAKDPILGVTEAFLADPNPDKVNVGVGAYRDDNGKPVVLECVREAERRIAGNANMEYLPMGGSIKMIEETIFRSVFPLILKSTFQSLPGPIIITSGEMPRSLKEHTITIIQSSRGLDFTALMDDIRMHQRVHSFCFMLVLIILLGVDPSEEQWREISYQFKVKGHFAFFDMAYQGFASGDPERDAKSIRIFLEDGHLIGCATILCKEYGSLWPEVQKAYFFLFLLMPLSAACSVVCEDEKQAVAVKSQLQQLARPMYSNPPVHGALIVSTILGDPDLKKLWLKEVKDMADRIIGMRTALRENLEKLGSPLSWEHVTKADWHVLLQRDDTGTSRSFDE